MVNVLWGVFIIIGVVFGFINGKIDLINNEIINSGRINVRDASYACFMDGINENCRR